MSDEEPSREPDSRIVADDWLTGRRHTVEHWQAEGLVVETDDMIPGDELLAKMDAVGLDRDGTGETG